jgi:hypothetical protein
MALGSLLVVAAVGVVLYLWWHSGDNQYRIEAVRRVVLGIPFLAVMTVAGILFGIYILAAFILDTIWQFATGRPGLSEGGRVERLQDWRDAWTRWCLRGGDRPRFVP